MFSLIFSARVQLREQVSALRSKQDLKNTPQVSPDLRIRWPLVPLQRTLTSDLTARIEEYLQQLG